VDDLGAGLEGSDPLVARGENCRFKGVQKTLGYYFR